MVVAKAPYRVARRQISGGIDGDDDLGLSRVSRAEALARRLEGEIVSAGLPPGERLGTKEELRQRFGIAVATLNEAVRLLETKGLITARPGPGGGVFVTQPSVQARLGRLVQGLDADRATLGDCLEFRTALEPVICRHAAARAGKRDIRRLAAIVDEMARVLDQPHEYFRANWELHRQIAGLCTNGPVRHVYLTMIDALVDGFDDFEFSHPTATAIDVHRRLLAAIESGDRRALDAALREHAKRSPLPAGGHVGGARGA
jgi:DNA-binding FadR family transcriptional regulator